MFRFRLFWIFSVFIVCSFCGKDFKSLGRHSSRCKKRRSNSSATGEQPIPILQNESNQVCKRIVVKCSCGKECKGVKGLKMHQRRCRVIEDMDEDKRSEFEILNDDVCSESTNEQVIEVANVRIKPLVKLPRSPDEWTAANNYFKAVFGNFQMQPTSIDLTIEFMKNTIYNYFANLYGTINSTNHTNAFCGKYKHLAPKSLKHQLKQLKMNDAPPRNQVHVSIAALKAEKPRFYSFFCHRSQLRSECIQKLLGLC